MKKIYIYSLMILFGLSLTAQTTSQNYTKKTSYRTQTTSGSVSNSHKIESVTYIDGLGRPSQSIGVRAGGTSKDLITYATYDAYGRQVKEYLPYLDGSSTGAFRTGDIDYNTRYYYNGEFGDDFNGVSSANPYSEKLLEASPLGRPEKQAAPGYDWRLGGGHEIEVDYSTNTSSEVRYYYVTFSSGNTEAPILSGGSTYYGAGELQKIITRDENHTSGTGHTTEEFTDKQGRVVLKRTYADSDNNGDGDTSDSGESNARHDTYYVYDEYGNLTYVLPPKTNSENGIPTSTERNELCYQYKYDRRNRIIEKKIPGKGLEYIVYNNLDQPVLTQDQNLEGQDKWLFTKYDALGRVAFSGYISNTNTRSTLQGTLDGASTNYEMRESSASSLGGTSLYYSNDAKPQTSISEIYTINYYDAYDNLNIGFTVPNSNTLGETIVKGIGTKGLPTVTKTKVLGTSNWITTATGYDNKGRVVWSKTHNPYLGTTETIEYDLDFSGNSMQTKTTHKKTGKSDIVIRDYFTYDHMNRLKKHTQTINGSSQEVIADNTYDELGQLVSKGVGNTNGSGRLQNVNYEYNVRGWLKQINNPASLGSDLFGFEINYNEPTHGGSAIYNGNISEAEWKTQNDNILRYYRYYYDDLNRITSGLANSTNYNLSNVVYDKNGNITKLSRNGPINSSASSFGSMDVLSYGYNSSSNRLKTVNDSGNNTYGFKDGSSDVTQYSYDANGNLTSDANKGIGTSTIPGIKYNHLNLPTEVKFNNSSSQVIKYTYDATGVKLRKEIPGKTTDYAGNFIYEGGTLQFFSTPEGYVSYDNGQFNYVYNYVDHLGNVRLSYTDGDGNGSIDPATEIIQEKNYYPFGLTHRGYNEDGSPYGNDALKRYGFGGKELQDESFSGNILNWYDITARNYDPALGRWMNIDPLAEKMPEWSPYNYAFNSPLRYVDPLGLAPEDIIFNSIDEDGNKTELGRIVTDELDVEIDIEQNTIPFEISEDYKPLKVNLGDSQIASSALENTGIQAFSLDISGEAAFKVGVQLEVSLIGVVAGKNKGDWGVALQGNGLVGLEGSVTGSASAYWPISNGDLSLDKLRGLEYGVQGSVVGVAGSYFEGFEFTNSYPFAQRVYGGASLGGSVGIPELGGSGSGYIGASDFLYRSDK